MDRTVIKHVFVTASRSQKLRYPKWFNNVDFPNGRGPAVSVVMRYPVVFQSVRPSDQLPSARPIRHACQGVKIKSDKHVAHPQRASQLGSASPSNRLTIPTTTNPHRGDWVDPARTGFGAWARRPWHYSRTPESRVCIRTVDCHPICAATPGREVCNQGKGVPSGGRGAGLSSLGLRGVLLPSQAPTLQQFPVPILGGGGGGEGAAHSSLVMATMSKKS